MAIILTVFRNETLDSNLSRDEMILLLGDISNDEKQFLKEWDNSVKSPYIKQIEEKYYVNFDTKDVKKYLEYKHCKHFPIPLSYVTKDKIKHILTYFLFLEFNIERHEKSFNDEQQLAIDISEGITIINAGPGTGKTTTACKRAFEKREEGVIFVSYTNAAIDENKKRMYDYPGTSSLQSSNFDKKYFFGTIDKISGMINGEISETYDHSVVEAEQKIKKRQFTFNQKHIIVDEAQDIDDVRARFIMTMILYGGFKSLTIFGDPRQKINETAGMWYRKMWIESGKKQVYKQLKLTRIGFTLSYRFKSKNILSLVNSLSVRRPELHCELKMQNNDIEEKNNFKCEHVIAEELPITLYNFTEENESVTLSEICDFIKYKHNIEREPYSEFIVIGPSLENENKTSLFSRRISTFFRNEDIPCKIFSEGSYESDGILFSTIQSSKGKEANYIFMFGMNNYPNSFSMIPYDESESLIFVSHSRAKKQMFYINNISQMTLPRGISDNHIFNKNSQKICSSMTEKLEPYSPTKIKSVTEILKCFNFQKLMTTNDLHLYSNHVKSSFPELKIPDDMQSDFFGTMIGIGVQIHCTGTLPIEYTKFIKNNYRPIERSIYNIVKETNNESDTYLEDLVYNEEMKVFIREIKRDESEERSYLLEKLKYFNDDIETMSNEDYYILTSISYYLKGELNESYNGYYDFDLNSYFKCVARQIKAKYGNIEGCEVPVTKNNIGGHIDILTETAVIELKTKQEISESDSLQTFLYKSLGEYKNKQGVLINLRLNKSFIVTSNRIVEYWLYFINGYNSIREQINFTRYKTRKDKVTLEFENNSFCVDTEFNTIDSSIFEIGIFNINDPYKSIIQTLNVPGSDLTFAKEWLNMSSEMFLTSPTICDVEKMFERLTFLFDETPTLYYYVCKVDHSWCDYANTYNVGNLTKQISVNNGTFTGNIGFPKLSDFYNSHVEFIRHQKHLKHHTALSDSLMLYSILKMSNIF